MLQLANMITCYYTHFEKRQKHHQYLFSWVGLAILHFIQRYWQSFTHNSLFFKPKLVLKKESYVFKFFVCFIIFNARNLNVKGWLIFNALDFFLSWWHNKTLHESRIKFQQVSSILHYKIDYIWHQSLKCNITHGTWTPACHCVWN